MNLTNTCTLKIVLSGAVSATQPRWTVDYSEIGSTSYSGGRASGNTNSTTEATMLAGPSSGDDLRVVTRAAIVNLDTADVTATVFIDDSGDQEQIVGTIPSGGTLMYSDGKWALLETLSTAEEIQDVVGGMLTGNTETGITVTYQDADGTIDFVVTGLTTTEFASAAISQWTNDSGYITGYTVTEGDVTGHESAIDHDALTNFVADEHINWKSTSENLSTSGSVAGGSLADSKGDARDIPRKSTVTTSYTLVAADSGKLIPVDDTSGGSIEIPNSVFSAGNYVAIEAIDGDVTITCTITTAELEGTVVDVATATLAEGGVCVIQFNSGTVCKLIGGGLA